MRITYGDVSFAYTGDTGLCAALDELADGVDVLLCEASWTSGPDRPEGLHLSGTQAGELAARARVGRLLLTHIPPWSDGDAILAEAEAAFDGPTERVTQGAVYEF